MINPAGSVPALMVETQALDDIGPLIPLLDPQHPLLFVRRGDGIAGLGEELRLEFSGPSRIADAASAWQRIVAAATVVDPVGVAGSGLVALGSFAFSDSSATTSVLIVPSVIIGRRDGRCWITRVRGGATEVATEGFAAVASEASSQARSALARVQLRRDPADRWRDPHSSSTPIETRLAEIQPAATGAEYRISLLPGAMTPTAFGAAVEAAVQRIREHDLSKVVLARDLVGTLPAGSDLRLAITPLALAYPDCFTFAVDGLIGSSPETLVRTDHGTVSARVLAGSTARGGDAETDRAAATDLMDSVKDREEHQYALESVLRALSPHSDSLATSAAPFALKLPNLWHLASDVTGALGDDSTSLDLVEALHPTAAVAGTPTPDALRLIEELEPFDRGRYAGPVGWVDANGDGEWAIALRCAQVDDSGTVTAYAGGGIVDGSIAEQELVETTLKFRPIVEAFG